jgi:diguanylate cyclase (GGDEF)-like protein
LLQVLQRGCREFFEADGGAVFEWHENELCLLESGWGDGGELIWSPQQDALVALAQGKLFPDCVEQQDLCGDRVATSRGFILCAPLHSRGAGVGALVMVRRDAFWRGDSIADQKLEQIVRALAEHTALALNNLTLREQLLEQSLSDPLTGLYNRRYLYEQMAHEMALWERSHQAFALILLDIDHFKSFNDRYGHDIGDEVLIALADLLHQHVRKSDVACRLGGEEFVVLMSGADQKRALARAEAIRNAVKKLVVPGVGPEHTISVSVGVAVYPDHGNNSHRLVRAADQALYESKRRGRDRTSLAGTG